MNLLPWGETSIFFKYPSDDHNLMYYFLVTNNGMFTDIPTDRSGSIEDIRRFVYLFLKTHRRDCRIGKIYKAGQKKSTFIGEIDVYRPSEPTWMGSAKGSYLYDLNPDGSLGKRYLNRRS